ncbi:MAG: hypothetical protein WBF09_05025 [Candidatus Acidiferrum sp.]
MKDFLDEAEGLLVRGELQPEDADEFQIVFSALSGLTHAHSKATLDLLNIESVFAAFEMAKLLGRLGSMTNEQIEKLPAAMNRVITRTLEKRIKFPVENVYLRGTEPYARLADLVVDRNPQTQFTFITFNYDLCLDVALSVRGVPYTYALGSFKQDGLKVLKLHGSLNWGKCTGCNSLVDYPISQYLHERTWPGGQSGLAEISKAAKSFTHCQKGKFEGQYVVPPTWNKSQYHERLELVWKAAATELSTAENIVVCGYSLPPSDQFFRYLYALGTVGEMRLKKFWVYDPDPTGAVRQRFETLLGQAVMPRFEYFPLKFEGMTALIGKYL